MFTTRIAPSPTGDFHIGTARTALFNWLAARASGGKFILRIDDTDLERNNEDSVRVIHESMEYLGLDFDETFRQSDRLDRYREVSDHMLLEGSAKRAENGAILLVGGEASPWNDMISGQVNPGPKHHELASGQVLMKADGMPVYHFASVVDDIDYDVNLVIRGIDHHTNTFRHTALYRVLEVESPLFSHLGLIMLNGKKMSKRDSAASLLGARDAGIDPDAMCNFLLRMGWGPKIDDKSVAMISREQALDLFLSGGRMRSSPANYDADKLASFDRKYKSRKRQAEKENVAPEGP